MPAPNFAPSDDPEVYCEVRLWEGKTVVVFVHPRVWSSVSMYSGTPMLISCCGTEFRCVVECCQEHLRSGQPKDVTPADFDVYSLHADYDGTARIDWPTAIPDLVRSGLESSPSCLAQWQSLSCRQMREQISHILRARRPGVVLERQMQLPQQLSDDRLGSIV